MKGVTADTQTWLAARSFLLDRCDDFYLQFTRSRETFDHEAIHDLRVSTRRLREGIAIFGHCFRRRQLAPIRKELKDLVNRLGFIRNTDEALLFFTPLAEKCDAATSGAMNIIAVLQGRRVEEQRQLKRELKKIDPGSLLGRIDELCNNPRIFNPDADSLFQPIVGCLLAAIKEREHPILELLTEALIEENVSAQHRLRLAVKRYRYGLEFLTPLSSGDYKGVYSLLKDYQEVLGHLHDLDLFSELTSEITTKSPSGQVVINIISNRRHTLFTEFLQLHSSDPLDKVGSRVRGLL